MVIQLRDAEADELRHAVVRTPCWANLCLLVCNCKWAAPCQRSVFTANTCWSSEGRDCLFVLHDSTENMGRKHKKKNTTYIPEQWKNREKGRALWCQWSLIRFLRSRSRVRLTEECVHGVCIVSATGHCTTGGSVYLPDSSPCHIMVMKLSAACFHFWPTR